MREECGKEQQAADDVEDGHWDEKEEKQALCGNAEMHDVACHCLQLAAVIAQKAECSHQL